MAIMRDSGREIDPLLERTEQQWATQIESYISTWLREHFYARAELNQFLMRHSCYGSHRDALLQECRLSCIACVLIAIRTAHGDTCFEGGFVDYLQRQAVKTFNKRKRVSDKDILALTDEEVAKIADYVGIHEYISRKAKCGDGPVSSTVHSCVSSIGYMTVRSVMERGLAGSYAFGSTVHLLHEVVAPLLQSAFESTRRAFSKGVGLHAPSISETERAQAG
jgi:hypothetical protein